MAQQTAAQPDASDVEKLLRDYQLIQEQLRSVAMQLEQLQAQKMEVERAKDELTKSTGKVYFSVGSVIVETTKEKALADVNERHELTTTRLTSFNKQYTEIRAKEKALNDKLTQMYKQNK